MRTLLFIFALLATLNTQAQQTWSLEKCIDFALQNSLAIQQQDLLVKNNEINIKEAQHARYPALNGSTSLNFNNGRTINPTSNDFVNTTLVSNGLNLSSSVNIYDGGIISNNIRSNKLAKDIALNDKEQQKRDLAINVARQYITVLLNKENIKISEVQIDATTQQLERLKKMVNAGLTPKGDLLEVEAQLASNEQNLISTKNGYQMSFVQLQQLMNTNAVFELEDISAEATLNVDNLTIDELLEKAISNHPKFKTFDLQQQQNQARLKIAKAGRLPRLSAGASVGSNYSNQAKSVTNTEFVNTTSPVIIDGKESQLTTVRAIPSFKDTPYFSQIKDNLSYGLGFSLNVPIYDNYRTSASIQRAKLNMQSTDLTKEIEIQNLRQSVAQTLTQAQTAKKSYFAASKTAEARQMAFDIAQKKFDIGKISVFELSNSRAQLQQSQINKIIAKYNYLLAQKMVEIYFDNTIK